MLTPHWKCGKSHVTCHMLHAMCHASHVSFYFFHFDKFIELVGGGAVINRPCLVFFVMQFFVWPWFSNILNILTSPGKCEFFCHPTTNFYFNFFNCYQDKMIPCFVEIFEWGEYEYQHSKSITKPKHNIQPHLALQCNIFWKVNFITKLDFHIHFKMAPWEGEGYILLFHIN